MTTSYTFSLAPDHRRSVSVVAMSRQEAQAFAEARMAERLTLLGETWPQGAILKLRAVEGGDDAMSTA